MVLVKISWMTFRMAIMAYESLLRTVTECWVRVFRPSVIDAIGLLDISTKNQITSVLLRRDA